MPSIFLVGFMASGKSEVSLALARRLNMPSVDLDSFIEKDAGQSIPAIFASEGEEGFRKREARALSTVIGQGEQIVATGGGTPTYRDNLSAMRAAGVVVNLATELATSLGRVGSDRASRPLLERPPELIERLYRERAPIYRRAHISVSTENKSPELVAADIESALTARARLGPSYQSASVVALGERSYPLVVERGCLAQLGQALRAVVPDCQRIGLVSDTRVAGLYGQAVRSSLAAAGFQLVEASVEPGEQSKDIEVFARVCDELIAGGLDRSSTVVALGGGVVGDLAGFVAASLFRGIALVHVPTTLLAMTDSSIGGKTGINSPQGKNLIGAFWQPKLVWADPDTLETLSPRERRAAFGELVKYALLDAALWPAAQSLAPALKSETLVVDEALTDFVRACADLKAAIVSADERERGLRATLNLGHTVGHAIEKAAGFGTLLHGEAVALGLLAACRVSHKLGFCEARLEQDVRAILQDAGLDTELDRWLSAEVLAHMGVDKKRTGTAVRFIAVDAPGLVRGHEMELAALITALLED